MKKYFILLVFLFISFSLFAGPYPDKIDNTLPNYGKQLVYLTGTASSLGSQGNPINVSITGGGGGGGTVSITETVNVKTLDAFGNTNGGLHNPYFSTIEGINIYSLNPEYITDTKSGMYNLLSTSSVLFSENGEALQQYNEPPTGNDFLQIVDSAANTWNSSDGGWVCPLAAWNLIPNFFGREESVLGVCTIDALGNTNGGINNPYSMQLVGFPTSSQNLFINSNILPLYVSPTSMAGTIKVNLTDTSGANSLTDATENSLIVISERHHEQHTGSYFSVGNTIAAMTTSSPKFLGIFVPAGVTIHTQINFVSSDGSYIAQLFSGSIGNAGNTLNSYNVNTASANVSTAIFYDNSNTLSAVALREPFWVGTTALTGTGRTGGNSQQSDDDYEILVPGQYFWKITAQTNGTDGSFSIPYYIQ